MSQKRSRATDDKLDELHLLTAEAMIYELNRYRNKEVLDEAGNPLPVPASLLAAVSKFLKDNGVDRPIAIGSAIDKLKDDLPDFDGINVVQFPNVR